MYSFPFSFSARKRKEEGLLLFGMCNYNDTESALRENQDGPWRLLV